MIRTEWYWSEPSLLFFHSLFSMLLKSTSSFWTHSAHSWPTEDARTTRTCSCHSSTWLFRMTAQDMVSLISALSTRVVIERPLQRYACTSSWSWLSTNLLQLTIYGTLLMEGIHLSRKSTLNSSIKWSTTRAVKRRSKLSHRTSLKTLQLMSTTDSSRLYMERWTSILCILDWRNTSRMWSTAMALTCQTQSIRFHSSRRYASLHGDLWPTTR